MPIFWDIKVRRPEFPEFYDSIVKLRANSTALRRGETVWVKNSDEGRVLTFLRKSSTEEILVAINMTSVPFFGAVEISGNFEDITPKQPRAMVGLPTLSLDSYGFRILRRR